MGSLSKRVQWNADEIAYSNFRIEGRAVRIFLWRQDLFDSKPCK